MSKKISRRNFLKGTGKLTAALATIWAVSPNLELPEVEPMAEEPETEEEDIWNEECHPYFCHGGVSLMMVDDWEVWNQ